MEVNGLYVNTVANEWQVIASGLPKAKETWTDTKPYFGKENKPPVAVGIDAYARLRVAFGGTACGYNFTFSYPIS